MPNFLGRWLRSLGLALDLKLFFFGMLKIANHHLYTHPLPQGHRFPMEKYDLLPKQLLYEGTCTAENFFEPEFASDEAIMAVHQENYFRRLRRLDLNRSEVMAVGFPLSKQLVDRERMLVGGTIMAARYALSDGIAMNIAGGTHHAFTNRGEGFCLLHDQAIAAKYLQQHKGIGKILFIDLDVHQGNGTAQIFKDDSSVFTFSMHGVNNYPFEKKTSDLDVALEDNTSDKVYLQTLEKYLPAILQEQDPEFVFYQSGVDILASDKLGRLDCSLDACRQRDKLVLQSCRDLDIPIQCSMGGGYSTELRSIINAHANTFRLAQEIFF